MSSRLFLICMCNSLLLCLSANAVRQPLPMSFAAADTIPSPWDRLQLVGPAMKPTPSSQQWLVPTGVATGAAALYWELRRERRLLPPCGLVPLSVVQPAHCGRANGRIALDIGSPGTYRYAWSDGTIGPSLEDVAAGTYRLTLTDAAASCRDTFTFSVPEHPPKYLLSLQTIAETCPHPGDIALVLVDTFGPYALELSGPAGTAHLDGVPPGSEVHFREVLDITAGTWLLRIRDAGAATQCVQMLHVEVAQAPPWALELLAVTPPSSSTASDGAVKIQVPDAERHPPPYAVWLAGELVGSYESPLIALEGLSAGTWHAVVYDAYGCPSDTLTWVLAPLGGGVGWLGLETVLPHIHTRQKGEAASVRVVPMASLRLERARWFCSFDAFVGLSANGTSWKASPVGRWQVGITRAGEALPVRLDLGAWGEVAASSERGFFAELSLWLWAPSHGGGLRLPMRLDYGGAAGTRWTVGLCWRVPLR